MEGNPIFHFRKLKAEIENALRRRIAENADLREQFRPFVLAQFKLRWISRFRSFSKALGFGFLFLLSCWLAQVLSRGSGTAGPKAFGPGDPTLFFNTQEAIVRLSLVGVLAWLGLCIYTTEKITKERSWYMCLPLPDRFFVGSFLRETFWVTVIIAIPMGISLTSILTANHWTLGSAILVSLVIAITVALGVVSGKEWVRRLVPATPMLNRIWVMSWIAIFLSLLLSVFPGKRELMEFGAGTMHAAQWLPSGWTFSTLGYAIGLFEELPIGAAIGIVAIVSCFIASRHGYQISEFVVTTAGTLQPQRAEYRGPSDRRYEERFVNYVEHMDLSFVAGCVELELQDLFRARVGKNIAVVARNPVATEAGLLGLRFRWRWSTAEVLSFLMLIGAFIHLLVTSMTQWLGSLSMFYLLPWIIVSSWFMSSNLKGNHTQYGPHTRSVAFAVCYLPMSLWDAFCGWIPRVRGVFAVKSLITMSFLTCLFWLGLPVSFAFYLWLLPLHTSLMRNAYCLVFHPIRDYDWRLLLYITPLLPLFLFSAMSSVVSLALLRSNSAAAITCLVGGIVATLACLRIMNWMALRGLYYWNDN